MQALYLEIKNLIINTLNLDELSVDDIDMIAVIADGQAIAVGIKRQAVGGAAADKAPRCGGIDRRPVVMAQKIVVAVIDPALEPAGAFHAIIVEKELEIVGGRLHHGEINVGRAKGLARL